MNNQLKISISQIGVQPLSSYSNITVTDGYLFSDFLSGSSIFYPTTAQGGTAWSSSANALTGGSFDFDTYQSLCGVTFRSNPVRIFCNTDVTFSLSGIDESVSRVTKVIYDFNDNSEILEVLSEISIQPYTSPKNIVVTKTYFSKDGSYMPSVSVFRSDNCFHVFKFPLSSFRCGILDVYENASLLDIQQSITNKNIVFTLEEKNQKQIFHNMLNTSSQLYNLTDILSGSTIPEAQATATTQVVTNPGYIASPIKPPPFNT